MNKIAKIMCTIIIVVCTIIIIVYNIPTYTTYTTEKIKVVTCTNLPEDNRLKLLEKSLDNAGFPTCDVLIPSGKFSWAKRLDEWKKYYNSCDPDTIILSLDAFDVLALKNTAKEIIYKFKLSGYKVLFGATTYCWPPECPICVNPNGMTTFLCAGTYIGYAGALAEILNTNDWTDDADDQCYFATFMNSEKNINNMVGLDTQASIFQSSSNRAPIIISTLNRVTNTETYTNPCILHYDSSHPTYDDLLKQVYLLNLGI